MSQRVLRPRLPFEDRFNYFLCPFLNRMLAVVYGEEPGRFLGYKPGNNPVSCREYSTVFIAGFVRTAFGEVPGDVARCALVGC
jgi:hypothetical protein